MGAGPLSGSRGHRRATAAIALLALAAACTTTPTATPHPGTTTPPPRTTTTTSTPTTTTPATSTTPAPPPDPLAGVRLYVNPASSAAQQEAQLRAAGQAQEATQIGKIATQPQGDWLTPDASRVQRDASALAHAAMAAGRTPLVVVYDLPFRDCAGYSAGGAADAAAYRSWLSALADGLGHSAPVVILEPDAIPTALGTCLSAAQRTERYGLMSDAVTMLTSRTGAHVYLDAGNSGWVQDIGALADALRSAGIGHAAGFALNVANFYTTTDSIAYGHKISQALGGAHFVIDTSRNGNGPAADDGTGAPHWCNPPGRALGHPPTATTSDPQVDALLWVKNPGESDGACRPGAPAAGQWWPQYALQLASASP